MLPGLWIAGDKLHELLARRRPFLTAKRLLTNQVFRDLYGTDTIDVEQRLKITSLTFLFTDLKGSTELYERVGDLVAFDLVRAHFQVLNEIVAAEAGAVVKTIGDAVMATFPTPDRAVAAALRMREAMRDLNDGHGGEDLLLKIGIHEGPCLAVVLNDRQDYFGTTVNIAARVQALADSRVILATGPVVDAPAGLDAAPRQRPRAGIAAPRAARHRRRGAGLRNSLIPLGVGRPFIRPRVARRSTARNASVGRRQEARQALGPGGLPGRLGDQILADLDLDMRQAAALAMHRDGVVGQIADSVGLVLADRKIRPRRAAARPAHARGAGRG